MIELNAFLNDIRDGNDSNKPVTKFDANKIKKKMKEYGVKKAELFLSGDRSHTNSTVKLIDGELHAKSIGVDGSTWATPTLDINGHHFDVGTQGECDILWDLDRNGNIIKEEVKE